MTTNATTTGSTFYVEATTPHQPHLPDESNKAMRWILQPFALITFHILNFMLGLTAFCVVVTCFFMGVALLPFCGAGLVVFQFLASAVEWFSRMDIVITNLLIRSPHPKLRLRVSTAFIHEERHNSRWLRWTKLSSRTIAMTIYFMSLKLVTAILSCVVCCMTVGVPLALAITPSNVHVLSDAIVYDDHPAEFLALSIVAWLIGVVGVVLVATLSRKWTANVCAEKSCLCSHSGSMITSTPKAVTTPIAMEAGYFVDTRSATLSDAPLIQPITTADKQVYM